MDDRTLYRTQYTCLAFGSRSPPPTYRLKRLKPCHAMSMASSDTMTSDTTYYTYIHVDVMYGPGILCALERDQQQV